MSWVIRLDARVRAGEKAFCSFGVVLCWQSFALVSVIKNWGFFFKKEKFLQLNIIKISLPPSRHTAAPGCRFHFDKESCLVSC